MSAQISMQTRYVQSSWAAARYAPPKAVSRTVVRNRQWRERLLGGLALMMLIVAWDATLRWDEREISASAATTGSIPSPAGAEEGRGRGFGP
jgi:hypothetical protein